MFQPEGTEGMADVLIQKFQQESSSQAWYVENVTITPQTSNFQIVIEGVIGMAGSDGDSNKGDAAIDDIQAYPGPC